MHIALDVDSPIAMGPAGISLEFKAARDETLTVLQSATTATHSVIGACI